MAQQPKGVDPFTQFADTSAPPPPSAHDVPIHGDPFAQYTDAADQPPPVESALSRFASGFGRTNPVTTTWNLASGLFTDPKATIKEAVFDPVAREAGLAKDALLHGQPAAALGHAAGAIPLVGPAIASPVERAQSGDVAGALGEGAGTALTLGLVKPTVEAAGGAAADVGRQIPGVSDVMRAAGERANRFSTREMAKATAPTGGPGKANLTAVAERIAPQLARAPELAGVHTHGGLISAVENGLDSAKEGLDTTLDQQLLATAHPIAPVIQGLEREQGKLTVAGDKGRVIPDSRLAEYNVHQRNIDQLKAMGDNASYEDLKNLRQSWDAPAAASKIYAKTEAEFAQKSVGQAYANGASVLRDYLANQSPEAAKANAKYALFVNAHKVLRAAEQASITQTPSTGQTLVTRGLGILAGKAVGGGPATEIGMAMVAPMLDKALGSVKTGFKVKVAQQFAALADALDSGKPAAIAKQTQSLREMLPPMKTSVRLGLNAGQFVGQAPPGDESADQPPPGVTPSTPGPPR